MNPTVPTCSEKAQLIQGSSQLSIKNPQPPGGCLSLLGRSNHDRQHQQGLSTARAGTLRPVDAEAVVTPEATPETITQRPSAPKLPSSRRQPRLPRLPRLETPAAAPAAAAARRLPPPPRRRRRPSPRPWLPQPLHRTGCAAAAIGRPVRCSSTERDRLRTQHPAAALREPAGSGGSAALWAAPDPAVRRPAHPADGSDPRSRIRRRWPRRPRRPRRARAAANGIRSAQAQRRRHAGRRSRDRCARRRRFGCRRDGHRRCTEPGHAVPSAVSPPQNVVVNNTDSVNEITAVAAKASPERRHDRGRRRRLPAAPAPASSSAKTATSSPTPTSSPSTAPRPTRTIQVTGQRRQALRRHAHRHRPGLRPRRDQARPTPPASRPITWADSSKLNVGDTAIAIGAPLGLSGTVTNGIVSALNRSITVASSAAPDHAGRDHDPDDGGGSSVRLRPRQPATVSQQPGRRPAAASRSPVIQTDAAINPGNSGGALLNSKGELIGINVAIANAGGSSTSAAGSIGVGFAIPSNLAKRVSDEIIESGTATHGLLGASVTERHQRRSSATVGALISEVTAGGAAADGRPADGRRRHQLQRCADHRRHRPHRPGAHPRGRRHGRPHLRARRQVRRRSPSPSGAHQLARVSSPPSALRRRSRPAAQCAAIVRRRRAQPWTE